MLYLEPLTHFLFIFRDSLEKESRLFLKHFCLFRLAFDSVSCQQGLKKLLQISGKSWGCSFRNVIRGVKYMCFWITAIIWFTYMEKKWIGMVECQTWVGFHVHNQFAGRNSIFRALREIWDLTVCFSTQGSVNSYGRFFVNRILTFHLESSLL